MNNSSKYSGYALVKEMLETVDVVKRFDPACTEKFVNSLMVKKGIFLTGEGSSRIFPAKHAIYQSMKSGGLIPVFTEGSTQSLEYQLDDFVVFGASNSGRTKEVVRLFSKLLDKGHDSIFGLTANKETKLEELAHISHILNCGKEDAVAATKSVIEQALFYDSLLYNYVGVEMSDLDQLADNIEKALTLEIDQELVNKMKNADVIYFGGRNTGVVEELALKTNEITRKKSDYLEGTYAVHGIEEVMDKNELLIVVDPFESEEEKFKECLIDGVGMDVVAISNRETSFPTIIIPDGGPYNSYVELAGGWNVLVEIGLALGIDLDKPVRARKVGNEYIIK